MVMKRRVVDIPAGATNYEIVAAVAGKRIVIAGFFLACGGDTNYLTFKSKPASGDARYISPIFALPAWNSLTLPPDWSFGWLQCYGDEALAVDTGGFPSSGTGTGTDGFSAIILYQEVDYVGTSP